MTRSVPVGGEKYLFIGGQEDGKYIETPGCMYHEVSVAELPPRAGEPSWKPQPRVRYRMRAFLIGMDLVDVYVIDGMGYSEARHRLDLLKSTHVPILGA